MTILVDIAQKQIHAMCMQGNGLAAPKQRPTVGTCGAPATAGNDESELDDSALLDESPLPGVTSRDAPTAAAGPSSAPEDDEFDAEADEAWEDAHNRTGLAYDANAASTDAVGTDTYHLTIDPGGGQRPHLHSCLALE